MGYANAHKQTTRNVQTHQGTVMPERKELNCPPFIGLMRNEEVLFVAHPSWLNYLFLLALSGLFFLAAIALICTSTRALSCTRASVAMIQAVTLILCGVTFLAYVIVNVLSNVAVVTNYRVITKVGIFSTRVSEVRIVDIRGISQTRGIWQTIIGVSNLGIGTAATGGTEIKIVGIRNASAMLALVNSLRPSP